MAGIKDMSRMQRWIVPSVLAAGLTFLAGCEPWGKPDEPEKPASEITEFSKLYGQNCAGCHGAEGKYGPGRILNDPLYLKLIPREELHKVLVYGRPGTAMPPWSLKQGGPLNDKQIDALVDGIYRNWAKPVNLHGTELPPYVGNLQDGDPAKGKRLFARNCFMCHGPGAAVGVITTPTYLQLSSNQMIRTSIIVGRSDLGMPNYQNLNAGKPLSNQDVTDLVSYLSSLRPAGVLTEDQHTLENGSGESGSATGEKGSGNGPGAKQKDQIEGHKHSNSSQSGGPIEQRKEQH
jgi:cytochrome c oxidase cbb3-type subunit III